MFESNSVRKCVETATTTSVRITRHISNVTFFFVSGRMVGRGGEQRVEHFISSYRRRRIFLHNAVVRILETHPKSCMIWCTFYEKRRKQSCTLITHCKINILHGRFCFDWRNKWFLELICDAVVPPLTFDRRRLPS